MVLMLVMLLLMMISSLLTCQLNDIHERHYSARSQMFPPDCARQHS